MNNLTCWRPKSSSDKWRWIFYDGDAGLKDVKHRSVAWATGDNKEPTSIEFRSSVFLRSLLQNEQFENQFIESARTLY